MHSSVLCLLHGTPRTPPWLKQMSAMSNRTVLVDNNTWNNTHIATVGRALASSEEKAYPIMEVYTAVFNTYWYLGSIDIPVVFLHPFFFYFFRFCLFACFGFLCFLLVPCACFYNYFVFFSFLVYHMCVCVFFRLFSFPLRVKLFVVVSRCGACFDEVNFLA